MTSQARESLQSDLAAVEIRLGEDPRNFVLGLDRARLLTRLNRSDEARQAYIDLIALDPTNFDALTEFGNLLQASGFGTAARTAWAEAAAHHPDRQIPNFVPGRPDVFMVGGESGSGKTTLGMMLLPMSMGLANFVSSDAIAVGLNPIRPETARIFSERIMMHYIRSLTSAKTSFGFESTCESLRHLQTLNRCRDAGYFITLIYLWLPSAELAFERVKIRTEQSRLHQVNCAILEDTIRRRYVTGIANMVDCYLPAADAAFIVDASDAVLDEKKIIAVKMPGQPLNICNPEIWNRIETVAGGKARAS